MFILVDGLFFELATGKKAKNQEQTFRRFDVLTF